MSDKNLAQEALSLLESQCNIEFYIGRPKANLLREAVGKPTVAVVKLEGEGKVAAVVKAENAKAEKPKEVEKPVVKKAEKATQGIAK